MKKVIEFLCGSIAVSTIGSLAACAGSSGSGVLPPGYAAAPIAAHNTKRKPQYCVPAPQCNGGDTGGGDTGGGGGDFGGGTGGESSGGGGGGGQVATLGNAKQGQPCDLGGGATSAPIGAVIDGLPDTPGTSGNEVNNAYYIPWASGTSPGSTAGYFGFMLTTFNGETWYQLPISSPTGGPLYINMGNISIAPNAPMTPTTWGNLITQALGGPQNAKLSPAAKNAASNFLNNSKNQMGSSGSAAIDPCFNGPWNGS